MSDFKPKMQIDVDDEPDRQPDVIHHRRPDKITDYEEQQQEILFRSKNNIELKLTIHTAEIIQVQYCLEGDSRSNFSYAIDPDFNPQPTDFQLNETENYFELTTSSLICCITKNHLLVHFYDSNGQILCEEKNGFYRRDSIMEGIQEIKISKKAPQDTSFWGMGDKAWSQDLRGKSFENWNTDAYGYERGEDPLYRSVPFYTALLDGQAYGIFLDNTYRSRFDFDVNQREISSFSAEGGVMNYYFIYGPKLTTVSERYTQLTGTPEMPPLWALGYHQSRWSYFPEKKVQSIAKTFRRKKIPCDALYLDIDYMDEYRCFTWDHDLFPNPTAMIEDLRDQGFETIVMIDPGIKVDNEYFVYQQGKKNGYFCKRPDGETAIAPVWPSLSGFPDFTHPDVRSWWADLYDDNIASKKVSGIWNDMNEPAVFEISDRTFPEDIRHHYDGHPCSHKKAHNIYGMQMARASLEGIKQHNPDKRPFLLTRANFAGGQRYAALWTGDNKATWDHLKLANEQCQRLSISGYSFTGADIGGFVDHPEAELFTRWLQLGIFHPLFRNHTMGYNVDGASLVKEKEVEAKKEATSSNQEPWVYGKRYTDINRSIIELRYRLLHYLYTAFRDYVQSGTPIIRPLRYYDQTDSNISAQNDEFMFGDHILVSPVLQQGKTRVKTYLPKGNWYDFRTNKFYEGKNDYAIDAPIEEIPFFVKEGTVLPLREVMQYTKERNPEWLELNIYYGNATSTSRLYEDSEEGPDYKDGAFLLSQFTMNADSEKQKLTLAVEREGTYTPAYHKIKIKLIGLPFEPLAIRVDENEISFKEESDSDSTTYHFKTHPGFAEVEIY